MPDGWIKNIWHGIKARCKTKDIPFALTEDDIRAAIPADGLCPVIKEPLIYGEMHRMRASIDRLIPNRGYVQGNIFIISYMANTMKNDATFEQVRALADWMEARIKEAKAL